jgi:hypothetical protein
MTVELRHVANVAPYIRKKLALTSPTTGVRSVGIVRSWSNATELTIYNIRCSFRKNFSYFALARSCGILLALFVLSSEYRAVLIGFIYQKHLDLFDPFQKLTNLTIVLRDCPQSIHTNNRILECTSV